MGEPVSIDDERELRARLGAALDELTPGPLPFNAVVRRGRAVAIRRRIAVAAVVGVIAAAVVGTSAVLYQPGTPPAPVTPAHYHVTVSPPGPGSPAGLIAGGLINGRHWQVTGRQADAGGPEICFQASTAWMSCRPGGPPRASHTGDPAVLTYGIGASPMAVIGTVRSDVAYLRVALTNEQTLTLRPVAVFGHRYARYVAFEVPSSTAVTRLTAYSARSELGYAIPFTAGGSVEVTRWLRPGEPALPKPASYLIGSGRLGGQPWSEHAYVGPWGVCIRGAGYGSSCAPVSIGRLAEGHAAKLILVSGGPAGTSFVVVAGAPSVSYLLVSRADGSTVRVATRLAGGTSFGTFTSAPGERAIRWVAYSRAGLRLASGGIP